MNIKVDYDIDTVFREWVFVRTSNNVQCSCGFDKMLPIVPVNMLTKDIGDWRICATCGGVLDNHLVTEYNRFNGYSGYDDELESEGCNV